jgi:hypothetical protein
VRIPPIASEYLAFGPVRPTPVAVIDSSSSLRSDAAHKDWHREVANEWPW